MQPLASPFVHAISCSSAATRANRARRWPSTRWEGAHRASAGAIRLACSLEMAVASPGFRRAGTMEQRHCRDRNAYCYAGRPCASTARARRKVTGRTGGAGLYSPGFSSMIFTAAHASPSQILLAH
jgi:hypothetical protein